MAVNIQENGDSIDNTRKRLEPRSNEKLGRNKRLKRKRKKRSKKSKESKLEVNEEKHSNNRALLTLPVYILVVLIFYGVLAIILTVGLSKVEESGYYNRTTATKILFVNINK